MNGFPFDRVNADVASIHRDTPNRVSSEAGPRGAVARERGLPFDAHLDMARHTFTGSEITNEEEAVRKGANELVATAFFKPIFKMLREDPLRSDVIPLSAGEKMFGPLLDAELAKRIADQERFPVAEAVVRRLLPEPPDANEASMGRAEERHQEAGQVDHRGSETKVNLHA